MRKRNHNHKKPSLEALRALLVFHEEGTVTAAARRLKLTQPVVTRKLAIFESATASGAILLRRSGQGLELTDAARDALPAIRELVQQYDQLLQYLQGTASATQTVHVGSGSFAAQYYLPRAIASIRDSGQPYQIETRIIRGEERIVALLEGRLDMAIVSHEPGLIEEQVEKVSGGKVRLAIEHLAALSMVVIAKKGTGEGKELEALPVRKQVPLQKLKTWELVGLDNRSGIRRQLERLLASPDELHFLSGGGWLAAKEFVRHGIGVAIVPLATLSAEDRHEFVIRPLADQFSVAHYLVHRPQRLSNTAVVVKRALQQAADALQEQKV